MSKLCFGSLLLLLLVAIWCDYTVESRRWIGMNRLEKNECNCRVLANKKVTCRKEHIPKTNKERLDMLMCLCKKHYKELSTKSEEDFQRACKKLSRSFSIPLPLA